jgi:hypothetical protein
MNQGQVAQTSAQKTQQDIAFKQMSNYWKQDIPAMNWAIEQTKMNEPALEDKAIGTGAATAGARGSDALQRAAMGGDVGSGKFVMGLSDVGDRASTASGLSGDAGLVGAKGNLYNEQAGIVGKGSDLLHRSDSMLGTSSGISEEQARANAQTDASRSQAGIEGAAALALMFM